MTFVMMAKYQDGIYAISDTGISLEGRFESKFTDAGYEVLVYEPHENY